MKRIFAALMFSFVLAGCVAHVTPEGTYLEPLPLSIIVGPPVIVEPPHHRVGLRPLPPIVVEPERHIYFYNDLYYYYWGSLWYYSERDRGPWHTLPREYYPKHYRERGRERHGDDGYRDRGRY